MANSNIIEFYQNSEITFYGEVEPNLWQSITVPGDEGVFILLKDGHPINRQNISHTAVNRPNITFYLSDVQVSDNGVYQLIHSSRHADLYTNKVSITVISINHSNTASKLISAHVVMYVCIKFITYYQINCVMV